MQVHEVIRGTDPDRVFAPDGAMEALVAAKKAGKIRFIGFTGHKSPAHPPQDAGDGRGPPLPVRHRADAAQRDGRPPRQLRTARAAGRPASGHRRAGDEAARVRRVLQERAARAEARLAGRMPSLLDGLAGVGRDHRLPVDARPRAGARRRLQDARDERGGAQGGPRAHGARPAPTGSGRSTRSPTCSTEPRATRTGSIRRSCRTRALRRAGGARPARSRTSPAGGRASRRPAPPRCPRRIRPVRRGGG